MANFTSGLNRRGFRGRGRPPLPGLVTTTTVKLSERHLQLARYLGRGNMSEGVRIALELVQPFLRNPPNLFGLLAVTARHGGLGTPEQYQREGAIPVDMDLQQVIAFLERAIEDSPAGKARAGETPHCYDHPEHDPECEACLLAVGRRAKRLQRAEAERAAATVPHTALPEPPPTGSTDILAGVTARGTVVTIDVPDEPGQETR